MNKPLEPLKKPELVKDSIPVDQQRLLVALTENAALSGFSTLEYSIPIDDLCRRLNLKGNRDDNLAVLRGLMEKAKLVFFCFALKYIGDQLWSTIEFAIGKSVFTDDALSYEYDEEMRDYLITFCHDGNFDGEAFLASDFAFGIQLPGHPVIMKPC